MQKPCVDFLIFFSTPKIVATRHRVPRRPIASERRPVGLMAGTSAQNPFCERKLKRTETEKILQLIETH